MSLTLRYPLRLDDVGRPMATSDPEQIWKDRAMILLSTIVGERPGDLFYGSDIAQSLFMGIDQIEISVKTAVQSAFARYMARVNLQSVTLDKSEASSGILKVVVAFTIPQGSQVEVSTVVDLAMISLG